MKTTPTTPTTPTQTAEEFRCSCGNLEHARRLAAGHPCSCANELCTNGTKCPRPGTRVRLTETLRAAARSFDTVAGKAGDVGKILAVKPLSADASDALFEILVDESGLTCYADQHEIEFLPTPDPTEEQEQAIRAAILYAAEKMASDYQMDRRQYAALRDMNDRGVTPEQLFAEIVRVLGGES